MDRDNLVARLTIESFGNEGHANSVHLMVTPRSPLQYRALGFHRHGENSRVLLLEKASDTRKSAAGSDTGDKGVDAPFHLLPQFVGGGGMVVVGIRAILELQCSKAARSFFSHGAATANSPCHGLFLRSADHGGAKAPHEDAFLLRKAFRHKKNHLVAAMHANQGQPNPGIPGRCLNDGSTWLQQTATLCVQNHAQRGPVLDAAPGIEELEFGVNVGRFRGYPPMKVEHGG